MYYFYYDSIKLLNFFELRYDYRVAVRYDFRIIFRSAPPYLKSRFFPGNLSIISFSDGDSKEFSIEFKIAFFSFLEQLIILIACSETSGNNLNITVINFSNDTMTNLNIKAQTLQMEIFLCG